MNLINRLFDLFITLSDNGGNFTKLTDIDKQIVDQRAGFFVKHDVHGLSLDELVKFSQKEVALGIYGVYFFMVPEHPLTIKNYTFREQVEIMLSIQEMGHDIGLHIDPYFLIDRYQKPLAVIFQDILDRFECHGISLCCGNIHGNSKFKGLDANHYGTSFDLFEEIARQPDFPELRFVPPETANLIRSNRVKLSDFGFTHWGDMPFWSEQNKYIVTNFISDNLLQSRGVLNVLIQNETIGYYKLSDRQPPGSRTHSLTRKLLPIKDVPNSLSKGGFQLEFDDVKTTSLFKSAARHPFQLLVHPQHYLL